MPLLSAEALSLQYGGKVIFDEDSVAVDPGDRLGIIGVNGAGKSTLMKVLAGDLQTDGGRVTRAKGIRVGYLAQEHGDPGEGSLLEQVLATAPGREAVEARLADVERALEEATEVEQQLELAEALAEVHALLDDLEQRFARHRAQGILSGLGFKEADLIRPVREFSGGWRMRAALAALLFQQPDVLLLDEPTNHLDLPSVEWLSTFLKGFKQALVLISHDREFINRQVKRVASLELEGLRHYKGNYDAYLEQRAVEIEFLENRSKKDEARKKELESFVERFKAKATKARQAQSRMRQLEKMEENQVELPKMRQAISIKFKPVSRAGDDVLKIKGLGHAYGTRPVFSGIDLLARRGDRIAIVGVNGAGKTTLLKLLAGELKASAGTIELGRNVTPSYFAQHHADVLDVRKTVLEEIWRAAPELSQTEARSICGAFLFGGDDVDKTVNVLSGGERARVALAKLLAHPGNLLLLDEPTNHLDIESASRLTDSLQAYDGTLLFVSHNLDFAKRLSTRVWDVHDGLVETYPGSFAEYLDRLHVDQGETPEPPKREAKAPPRAPAKAAPPTDKKRKAALTQRIAALESEIAELETEQGALEASLASPALHADPALMRSTTERYQSTKSRLEKALAEWEQRQAELASVG